jgi:hypothetical protein
MLRCGPSNRTFVHYAAFLLAERSVCGRRGHSLQEAPMTALRVWFQRVAENGRNVCHSHFQNIHLRNS